MSEQEVLQLQDDDNTNKSLIGFDQSRWYNTYNGISTNNFMNMLQQECNKKSWCVQCSWNDNPESFDMYGLSQHIQCQPKKQYADAKNLLMNLLNKFKPSYQPVSFTCSNGNFKSLQIPRLVGDENIVHIKIVFTGHRMEFVRNKGRIYIKPFIDVQ